MKSFNLTRAALIASALIAAPVAAQTAETTTTGQAQTTAQAPAQAPAPITDAEVTMFAKAALAADKVQKDTTIAPADKGQRLAAAVIGNGLQPARFNEIASASDTDPALKQKIQAAIVAQQKAAVAPTTPAAPATAATPSQ